MDSFDAGFLIGHATGIMLGAYCAWWLTSSHYLRMFRRWIDETFGDTP